MAASMEVKKTAQVKELLWEVLEIQPAKRREYLDNSGAAADIRAEVESLLSFEAASADFMSVAITDFMKDLEPEIDAGETSLLGQKIDVYEIVGELGFGGMGSVYLAERTDGKFSQRVAIKMLKREFNVEQIRQTFRREKEILAKLEHSNIARLLDAGTTIEGVPYLVMEFVAGLPIDKFCEENNLSLIARLKLFNKVCEAVSFAHRNLTVHRDLKPSNILVTEKGEPKLLDFGISKLLGVEDPKERSLVTDLGAMTPEYASPEQIRGEAISTATDIYSLGVVLYKILTNAHPFDLKGKSGGELVKVITEDEPRIPSAISNANRNPNNTIPKQHLRSAIRNPQLKGDLDNIILKSLSKEPERRYKTVEQFSADIWRFIDGLPVAARRATLGYRTSKFLRRNKLAVIAVGLIFLSLITGIAVAIRQTNLAREQAQLSAIESDKSKTEQAKSEKITRFMSKIIGYANPAWYADGSRFDGNARVIEAVEDLSDKIDEEFTGEPDVAAELHHKFSEVFLWMAKGAGGEQLENFRRKRKFHALRALEVRRSVYGERHELVAKDLFYSYALIGNNDYEHAEVLADAIEMMRETNPQNLNFPYMLEAYAAHLMMPEFEELHESYRKAARPFRNENKYAIAEKYLREALPMFRFHYKEENRAVLGNECRLAYALVKQENRADFDEHYALCKQYSGVSTHEKAEVDYKYYVDLIEKVLAEKK